MAYLITLLESTPHRLRYKVVADGRDPDALIVNRGNGTATGHDLRDDSYNSGPSLTPMNSLVRELVATNAAAKKLLDGNGLILPADIDTPRAHVSLVPVNSEISMWGVTQGEGTASGDAASANHAVIVVRGPAIGDAAVIVDIAFAHTEYR
jgi:hypothetical protein